MKAFLQKPVTWLNLFVLAVVSYLVSTGKLTLEQAPVTFGALAGPLSLYFGITEHAATTAAATTAAASAPTPAAATTAPPTP